MTNSAPLTEAEVRQFAVDWYKKLDVHAPEAELLPMLADDGLEMVFPEATIYGYAGFEGWYQGVMRIFFDEEHELTQLSAVINGDQADVTLVVNWQASRWMPPAATSDRLKMDAAQTWIVKRSPDTGKPIITKYVVDKITLMEGSASL